MPLPIGKSTEAAPLAPRSGLLHARGPAPVPVEPESVAAAGPALVCSQPDGHSRKGGMIRSETLIELKFINSCFSSLSSSWN